MPKARLALAGAILSILAAAMSACATSSGTDTPSTADTSSSSTAGAATATTADGQAPGSDPFEARPDEDELGPFRLVSPAFAAGAPIPARFTCDGEDVSPPLQWNAQPDGTQSLAIVMVDHDAPVPGGFTHWVVTGLDPPGGGVGEASTEGVAGVNSAGTTGWSGPCPPSSTHTYTFTVYAFDHVTDFGAAPTREQVESEPGRRGSTTLTGTYTSSGGDD